MIHAIVAGAKTETRRVILPVPERARTIAGHRIPYHSGKPVVCRFGQFGDRLWVRERWRYAVKNRNRMVRAYEYAADADAPTNVRWLPSFMMPRCASRLSLEITACHAERLRNITSVDAIAEGYPAMTAAIADPIQWFRSVWNQLAPAEQTWRQNPWVWVIRFRVR